MILIAWFGLVGRKEGSIPNMGSCNTSWRLQPLPTLICANENWKTYWLVFITFASTLCRLTTWDSIYHYSITEPPSVTSIEMQDPHPGDNYQSLNIVESVSWTTLRTSRRCSLLETGCARPEEFLFMGQLGHFSLCRSRWTKEQQFFIPVSSYFLSRC